MNDSEARPATNGVLIVSGPPGAGKSTVASLAAAQRGSASVCIEMDWIWTTITTGFIPPWEPASEHQNQTVIRSVAAFATEMVSGGYSVTIEGVVGPWHLPIFIDAFTAIGVHVDYVVLRPVLPTCVARAFGRTGETPRVKDHPPLTDSGPIRHMWEQFADLGRFESHALDTTDLNAAESADRVLAALADGRLRV